eukprot:7029784-Pyramimonas_sp.AAC.1
MSVTVLKLCASAISLSRLREKADAGELRPGPVPHECALRCGAVQAAEMGLLILLHILTIELSKPIRRVPPSGLGSRTRSVTSLCGGHPSLPSHAVNMSDRANTA